MRHKRILPVPLTLSLQAAAVVACCMAAALVAAPAASAKVECQGVANCTTVAGPWVAVTKPTDPTDYGAMWTGFCPTESMVAGTDWAVPDPTHAGYLDVYIEQASGAPIYGINGLSFIALNRTAKPLTFQPLIGCQPFDSAAARASTAGRSRSKTVGCTLTDPRCAREQRVAVHDLRPGRVFTFTHRCRKGERLVRGGSGVGFFEKRPPSRRELAEVEVSRRERRGARGRMTVRIRTGAHVGDDERVQAQVHTFCV
jgi:hypothetical protein